MEKHVDFTIKDLGERTIASPIKLSKKENDYIANYVSDVELVRIDANVGLDKFPKLNRSDFFEAAGPREKIYFSPQHVKAGIVTCGGLCPGLNDVIRAIVRCLYLRYGVANIVGFQFGYMGFLTNEDGVGHPLVKLTPEVVDDIHKLGGTILGTARGGGKQVKEIVDTIQRENLNMLFTIGGDGTQKGALDIANEILRRKLNISVIGIPKTVDNDFAFIQKSFGFDTAVTEAVEAVTAAHMEAHSQINGIGLVKLMGRESGFIAAHTALASHEVNFVLIPEVPFDLEGPNGLMCHLEARLKKRGHAVIVVAEGAMQDVLVKEQKHDASGNLKMEDVGRYLKDEIEKYFKVKGIEINLKYIDPSYMIRSAPAVPVDSIYCERLGNAAAHAAMAGKTKCVIGLVNNEFVHLPMEAAVSKRSKVEPEESLWRDTLDATNQPFLMKNDCVIPADKEGC